MPDYFQDEYEDNGKDDNNTNNNNDDDIQIVKSRRKKTPQSTMIPFSLSKTRFAQKDRAGFEFQARQSDDEAAEQVFVQTDMEAFLQPKKKSKWINFLNTVFLKKFELTLSSRTPIGHGHQCSQNHKLFFEGKTLYKNRHDW